LGYSGYPSRPGKAITVLLRAELTIPSGHR
jgi:hypothetical protein